MLETLVLERVEVVDVTTVDETAVAVKPLIARLSVVIPAYNESARLPLTLSATYEYLTEVFEDFELVLVDDGSTDGTVEIANRFAAIHPHLRVLTIPHAGKAAAVRHGLLEATGDYVAFVDADLATPLSYLLSFVDIAERGVDVVIGSREGLTASRLGEPRYRHVMGRVFNRIVQLLVLPGIEDTQCGFKLFRRDSIRRIFDNTRLYREPNVVSGPRVTAFDVELLVVARALDMTVEVVPVIWTYGTNSKVNPIRDTLYNLSDILKVRANLTLGRYR